MERLRDVIGHSHEFIIRGRRAHALYRGMTNGPRDITQTERERCRGIPGEVLQREWFISGELRHDIGEGDGETVKVFFIRSGP